MDNIQMTKDFGFKVLNHLVLKSFWLGKGTVTLKKPLWELNLKKNTQREATSSSEPTGPAVVEVTYTLHSWINPSPLLPRWLGRLSTAGAFTRPWS